MMIISSRNQRWFPDIVQVAVKALRRVNGNEKAILVSTQVDGPLFPEWFSDLKVSEVYSSAQYLVTNLTPKRPAIPRHILRCGT